MQTATVTIEAAYPPKDATWKNGRIKTTELGYVNVPKELIPTFAVGSSVAIKYEERVSDNGSTSLKYLGPAAPGTSSTAMNVSKPPNIDRDYANRDVQKPNGSHYAQHDAKDKFIFATGIVGRAMGSGKFEIDDILPLLESACSAFDKIMGSVP